MRRRLAGPFALGLLAVLAGPVRADSGYLWEGFEREQLWEADTSGAATGRELDAANFTEGTHGLRLDYRAASAAGRAEVGRRETLDWSPYGALTLDIFVPPDGPVPQAALVVQTTDRWLEHDAALPPLAPGWNRGVRVDLLAPVFASLASDWRADGHLVGRGDVRRVALRVTPGSATSGYVTFDRLRLERSGLLAVGDVTVNATADLTASAGRLDYLPPGLRLRPGDLTQLEGFDGAPFATADTAGVTVTRSVDRRGEGPAALGLTFPAAPDGFTVDLSALAGRLAGARQIRLDVWCDGPGAQLTLHLIGADGTSYDFSQVWLGHGWNTPVFDFTNPNAWQGAAVTPAVLASRTGVTLTVVSRYPGRIVVDGLDGAAVAARGAGRAGLTLHSTWHPDEAFEATADVRGEDAGYGRSLGTARDTGAEGWLDAARVRWDAGGFRTRLLYRSKITPMDQPSYVLIAPGNLGQEAAAAETAGRVLGNEVQLLAASRLEYDRLRSRQPTGFGPEQVGAVRVRREVAPGTRIGLTQIAHLAAWPPAVGGIPRRRFTTGADAETHVESGDASLNASAEGAVTAGPVLEDPAALAPARDRWYGNAAVAPGWRRLSLTAGYTRFGHDFDGDFTTYGNDWEGPNGEIGIALDGLGPLTGPLAKNLKLTYDVWASRSRGRVVDARTGRLVPRTTTAEHSAWLGNDDQTHPHLAAGVGRNSSADPWYRTDEDWLKANGRLPLPAELVLSLGGGLSMAREIDRPAGQSGVTRGRQADLGLERWFRSNLYLHAEAALRRTAKVWEGAAEAPASHVKFTAGARQSVGANTTVQLDFGQPALYGYDYGVQDTFRVVTLQVTSYF